MFSGKYAAAAVCGFAVVCSSHVTAADRYAVTELARSERHYLQFNNQQSALTMRQDSPDPRHLHIVIENWQSGLYSEFRPFSSTYRSWAHAFNDTRQITGYGESVDGNGELYEADGSPRVQRRAFLYSNGSFTDLSELSPLTRGPVATNGWGSEGVAINNQGDVAGIWTDANGTHGFAYSQGVAVELGTLGSATHIDTRPTAINSFGNIVGVSGDQQSGSGPHAFLYAGGPLQDLGVVGAHLYSAATDMNDAGQIVGKLGGSPHGNRCFLFENGLMRELGTLGGQQCYTAKINNAGVVVGSTNPGGARQNDPIAYVYANGQMVDLNSLANWSSFQLSQGWVLTDVLSINDDGFLLAAGQTPTGGSGSFLLHPTQQNPERYGFENDLQGWQSTGESIVAVGTSAEQHFAGDRSLQIQISSGGFASVAVPNPVVYSAQTIQFRIFIPLDAHIAWIQPFALEGQAGGWRWHGNWQPVGALELGAWNTLTVRVPNDARELASLGVEFYVDAGHGSTVYVDNVSVH